MASLTWNGGLNLTVSADAAIDSDPVSLSGPPAAIGFSLIVLVTGTGPSGISGNFELIGVNDGIEAVIATQAVRVGSGQQETFSWSEFSFYGSVFLRWTQAGAPDSGMLGAGAWNVTAAPAGQAAAPMPVLPTVLAANEGTVLAAVDRLAQYLRGVPPAAGAPTSNVRAIIQIIANRFAEAGQAIQGIATARAWAALSSGNCTNLLQQLGKLVGAPPPQFASSDAQFCSYIRAAIAADHSSGGIEDIYAIARLILPPSISLRVQEYAPSATFVLKVTDSVGLLGAAGAAWVDPYPLAAGADGAGYVAPFGASNSGSRAIDALAYFLRRARPGGIWAVVDYELSRDALAFTCYGPWNGSNPFPKNTGVGLATSAVSGDGGNLRGWEQ